MELEPQHTSLRGSRNAAAAPPSFGPSWPHVRNVVRQQRWLGSRSRTHCACRKASEAYDLLLIKAGATLLTPWERLLYFLTVCAIAILVSVGVAKAAAFYSSRIQALLSQ